ncbi:hypothetical protein CLOM_g2172 [Closterium sp. NIES-68]|nr:hypothetical protein CLOM_g2172 [Closterium sp. NIES-68]GJP68790.1 hypothetical protein CLOP_g25448 [Closterium sp. NIES-67]
MAKGSVSQASTSVARGGSGAVSRGAAAGGAPKGVGSAGLRRRRPTAAATSSAANNMLRFYTDDAPGLKITPTVVLVMSLCFIGFVTALHVVGKLYGYSSAK